MKKQSPQKKPSHYHSNEPASKLEEPVAIFKKNLQQVPGVKAVTSQDFKKVAEKIPFTQAEWATMLHISERTLQRYAKNNGAFASINAERFHQLNQVIGRGKQVLGSAAFFYTWIQSNPPAMDGQLSFASLTTYEGIQQVISQLGRIEHGILA